MTNQHSFVSADRFDRDVYTSCQIREHVLNAAIVQADISESFEEYLKIFDAFYADDIDFEFSESQRHRRRARKGADILLFQNLLMFRRAIALKLRAYSCCPSAQSGESILDAHTEVTACYRLPADRQPWPYQ